MALSIPSPINPPQAFVKMHLSVTMLPSPLKLGQAFAVLWAFLGPSYACINILF